jgi:acyl transferase domain-containing protein
VRHADGILEPSSPDEPTVGAWPPADASEVDVTGWYAALAEHGLTYGPTFQGLRAVWRRGAEVYAEVELPEPAHGDAAPALIEPEADDAVEAVVGGGNGGKNRADIGPLLRTARDG